MLYYIQKYLLIIIFLMCTFQRSLSKPLNFLSKALNVELLQAPSFFYKPLFFYPVDISIVLFCLLTLYAARRHLASYLWNPPSKYLILFLVTTLASLIYNGAHPLHYFRLGHLGLFFLFFCALRDFLQRYHFKESLSSLLMTVTLVSMIQVTLGAAQFLNKHALGLKRWGEENVTLFALPSSLSDTVRASGTLPHPNIFGGVIFFSLVITFYLTLMETGRFKKALFSLCLLFQLTGLVMSLSRSALFAALLALPLLLLLLRYRSVLSFKNSLPPVLTLMGGFCITFILFYPQIQQKGGILGYNELAHTCDQERIVYQKMAWAMVCDHPLLGVGFNHFQLHSVAYTPTHYLLPLHTKVHNIFLLILAETGIVGMVCFLCFLVTILYPLILRTDPLSALCLALLSGFFLIGNCDFYLFDGEIGRLLLFTTLSISSVGRQPLLQMTPNHTC